VTRPLVPLEEDERLVAEVRCGGNGGKCQALLGQVRQHRGAPGLFLTLHKPGRWEAWCPLTFEGGTDLFWCQKHPVVTVDGPGKRRYSHGLGTRWVDYTELEPVFEDFTRYGTAQKWLLIPTEPPAGVPARPPRRGMPLQK